MVREDVIALWLAGWLIIKTRNGLCSGEKAFFSPLIEYCMQPVRQFSAYTRALKRDGICFQVAVLLVEGIYKNNNWSTISISFSKAV